MQTINDNHKAVVCCRFAIDLPPTPTIAKKTALYCRAASQDDFAILMQIERLYHYAVEHGHENICCYADNGESGASLDRPALNMLIEDIRAGEVQTVIAVNADRIARGLVPFMEWMGFLEKEKVECVFLNMPDWDNCAEFSFWCDFLASIEPSLHEVQSTLSSFA